MNAPRLVLPAAIASLAVVASAACYSSTAPGDAPSTSSPTTATTTGGQDSGTPSDAGDTAFDRGEQLVQMNGCPGCHGADLSGNIKQSSGVYSANLTPDMNTGILSWTLTNLTNALRHGTDDQGQMICASMPLFPMLSDDDIVDMYAYLQGIPAVSKEQTNTDCQGNPANGDDDDDSGSDASTSDATAPDGDGGNEAGTDAATDGSADAGDPCPHLVCTEGAALAPSCGGCATKVCNNDPSCCDTAWGATCVSEVAKYCVTRCN